MQNSPSTVRITVGDGHNTNARVLGEDRNVTITHGVSTINLKDTVYIFIRFRRTLIRKRMGLAAKWNAIGYPQSLRTAGGRVAIVRPRVGPGYGDMKRPRIRIFHWPDRRVLPSQVSMPYDQAHPRAQEMTFGQVFFFVLISFLSMSTPAAYAIECVVNGRVTG